MVTTLNRTAARMSSAAGALSIGVRKRFGASFELNAEFNVLPGITILFGPSGAGKTALLDCVAGLNRPDSGRIAVGKSVFFDAEQKIDIAVRKRKIGYVFQDAALFPHLTVEANVGYGLSEIPVKERRERIDKAMESLSIQALGQRRPDKLSGGERQRVALARALVTQPALLLLDEPLAAIDLPVRMRIADDLRRLIQERPIPVLYVTHSRDEVFMLGEKLLVIEQGELIARGTPHQVLSAPRQETVAQLAGFENIFGAEVVSIHEDKGTMTCRLFRDGPPGVPVPGGELRNDGANLGRVEFETPLVRAEVGTRLRVAISAGDILVATSAPLGLSARNILPGRLISLSQRDAMVTARVECGVELLVNLTLGARDSLALNPGRQVWVIVKTHSCHLLAG